MGEFEWEKIIPAGVAVAGVTWVLAQFAGFLAATKERRRLRSQALPVLIDLYIYQFRLNCILRHFNESLGSALEKIVNALAADGSPKAASRNVVNQLISDFERSRQMNIDISDLGEPAFFTSIAKSTDFLAQVDPVMSFKIMRLTREFRTFANIKFPAESLEPKPYLESLSKIIGVFRADMQELRGLILGLARRISFMEYFRLLFLLRSEEKLLSADKGDDIDMLLRSIRPRPPVSAEEEGNVE